MCSKKSMIWRSNFAALPVTKKTNCSCNPTIDRVRLYLQTQDLIDIGVYRNLKFSKGNKKRNWVRAHRLFEFPPRQRFDATQMPGVFQAYETNSDRTTDYSRE